MSDDPEQRPDAGQGPEAETPPAPACPAGAPAAQPEGEGAAAEGNTISLLDLMAEEQAARDKRPRPAPPPAAGEDEATPTGMPIPTNLPPRQQAPLPPIARDKTLPARPPERDENATRVEPGMAFPGSTDPRFARRPVVPRFTGEDATLPPTPQRPSPPSGFPHRQPIRRPPAPAQVFTPAAAPRLQPAPRGRDWGGCLLRLTLAGLLALLVGIALAGVAAVVGYTSVASDLPDVADLEGKVSQCERAVIYERDG
jgi:hypothetical protein